MICQAGGSNASFVGQLRVLVNDTANANALAAVELLVSACMKAGDWVGLDLYLTARSLGEPTAQQPLLHPLAWFRITDYSAQILRCFRTAMNAGLIEIRNDSDGYYAVPTQQLVDRLLAAH